MLAIYRVWSFFILLVILCVDTSRSPAEAQEWVRKLFKETHHDFGTVSRNAKAEHSFVIENCFEEDVHIASVRSSCGCTSPVATKPTLKSWEKGEILAKFNTRTFTGTKSAVITVVIDKPYYAEIQLTVGGTIRTDVSIEPGEIVFGDVELGQSRTIDLSLSFNGKKGLQIADVRGNAQAFEVVLDKPMYQPSGVMYRMHVKLKESLTPAKIVDEVIVVTNDPDERNREFSIPVSARVRPPITVTPETIAMGDVRSGETRQQRFIVKGKKPFSIDLITCGDDRFEFQTPAGEKTTHIVPFTFRGTSTQTDANEKIDQKVVIVTSLGEQVEAALSARVLR
ncbi:MAG: DUF1573 domain-containing protein [Planctomycetaceae bacterium]|jgi:hypothetical protein|nr:DUF1573 domain-containing protein [Planctomycetaceae bacterium]